MSYPLLADFKKEISREYDVLLEDMGVALRGLFIIDHNGVVRNMSINDLPVGRSVDETIRLVKAFQFVDEHGEGSIFLIPILNLPFLTCRCDILFGKVTFMGSIFRDIMFSTTIVGELTIYNHFFRFKLLSIYRIIYLLNMFRFNELVNDLKSII